VLAPPPCSPTLIAPGTSPSRPAGRPYLTMSPYQMNAGQGWGVRDAKWKAPTWVTTSGGSGTCPPSSGSSHAPAATTTTRARQDRSAVCTAAPSAPASTRRNGARGAPPPPPAAGRGAGGGGAVADLRAARGGDRAHRGHGTLRVDDA